MTVKKIASVKELESAEYAACMEEINAIARRCGLDEYRSWSRLWEYPWIWMQLREMAGRSLSVIDIGTQRSPLAWLLASKGFEVTASDLRAQFWGVWERANRRAGLQVKKKLLDAQRINLPPASMDIYLSLSVIEHVPDKARAVEEAARLLKPGGALAITFDLVEPEMGMTFPAWNGRALTMKEFDALFGISPWFEPGIAEMSWNTEDIAAFLAWNRTTVPTHDYIVGGAILTRNQRVWEEEASRRFFGNMARTARTAVSVPLWKVLTTAGRIRRALIRAKS